MAKRFTDTGKWVKASFAELSLKLKLVWIYLCDNCDHAGIWDPNFGLMSYQLGAKVDRADLEAFGDKIEWRGSKVYIPSFVDFQYGNLNPENRVHKSILDKVQKLSPLEAPSIDHARPLKGSMDMDMELDMELDRGSAEGGISFADLEAAYRLYPLKKGKERGLKTAKAQIKTQSDLIDLRRAIEAYKADVARNGTEKQFIKHFSTFMGEWRDWLDPEAGTAMPLDKPKSDYSWLTKNGETA